ncbi:MAG: Ni/Fe-hydrogenase, b-type cytochrome subunit [Calditrichia bacterium]
MANTIKYDKFERVYVWQIPVRLYHWVNALCIVILAATGLIIGDPFVLVSAKEASFQYWFGTVRFIHFATAWIFMFNFTYRIFFGFFGNEFANWHNFIPTTKKQWREIIEVLKVDILQVKEKPLESAGHNALAGLTYFLTFIAFLFQVVTGFGLYAAMSTNWFAGLFTWVSPLMGGDFALRHIHHIMTWFFIIFSIVHVYLVFYHDYVEGRGTTSSMIGGWKFIEKECDRD